MYYNNRIKNRFLNEYMESTQSTYKRIFVSSLPMEGMLKKDLYDFSKEEISLVLADMNPSTASSSESNGRMITAYINWCINQGYRKSINPLSAVSPEWFGQFVDKNIQLYFSEDTLNTYESYCQNAQDALCMRLLFEGVNGKQVSEIRNLKKDDVDFKNKILKLTDFDGSIRKIEVFSDKTLELIEEALEVKTYIKRNGLMIEHENVREFTDLTENDYVLRSSITATKTLEKPVDKAVVYRRINMIEDTLGIPYLNGKNIQRSGMIYMGKIIYEREGKLEKEQYLQIAERFQISKWFVIKNFCNLESIRELYGDIKTTSDSSNTYV
jgi:integrase